MKEFSVYHRKDGRWEGRIPKERKSGEKRSFHYFFGRSCESVRKRMEEFCSAFVTHECNVALKTVFADWLHRAKLRIKESTYANYCIKWNNHIMPKFGEVSISSINTENICSFIVEKQQSGLSNRYITDIIVLMKSVFKYAAKQYHIENPLDGVNMPKKRPVQIALLDEMQQKILNSYLLDNQSRSNLAISLAMTTGIRIGELCALQWEDIDFEKRILTVKKTLQRIQSMDSIHKTKIILTDPKSETSNRCIPIPDCMIGPLSKYRGKGNEFLCSGNERPIEPRTMQYRFAKILKNVKLPSIHFHALRHMFASKCVKLGFDIKSLSEILGHSNVRITLERYVHSDFSVKQEYMKRISFD